MPLNIHQRYIVSTQLRAESVLQLKAHGSLSRRWLLSKGSCGWLEAGLPLPRNSPYLVHYDSIIGRIVFILY
jgi:hypothetical protein